MRRFFEYLGYVLGLIGILLSVYFYEATKSNREPTFIVEPIRTEILNSANIKNFPIQIYKSDTIKISRTLTSIRFYFWNKGKGAIKRDNILSDIVIRTENETNIIHHRVLKKSRDVCGIILERLDSNSLRLRFNILETNDGFTGEVLLEGNPNAKLFTAGTIEGVESFSDFPVNLYSLLGKTFTNILIGCLVLGTMIITYGGGRSYDPDHIAMKSNKEYESDGEYKKAVDELEIKYDDWQQSREVARQIINPKKEVSETELIKKKKRNNVILIAVVALVVTSAIIFAWYQTKQQIIDNPNGYIPKSIQA